MSNQSSLRSAMLLSASVLSILAAPAIAQDAQITDAAAPQAADDAGEQAIVVTGSRIQQRADYNTPNPIVAVTAETLQQAGNIQIVETLAQNPALLNSLSGARTSGSNADFGAVGVQLLDLRGLGENRTLTLVNGRRHVSSLAGTAAVDVNSIPVDLIESVDVLTGGASAIYGADGVSGVVNFRLKRNFDGLIASGQIGISEEGDAGQRFGAVTYGRVDSTLKCEIRGFLRLQPHSEERKWEPNIASLDGMIARRFRG